MSISGVASRVHRRLRWRMRGRVNSEEYRSRVNQFGFVLNISWACAGLLKRRIRTRDAGVGPHRMRKSHVEKFKPRKSRFIRISQIHPLLYVEIITSIERQPILELGEHTLKSNTKARV